MEDEQEQDEKTEKSEKTERLGLGDEALYIGDIFSPGLFYKPGLKVPH